MVPTIDSVVPATGSTSGGELVRVTARGLAIGVDVAFGESRGAVIARRADGAVFVLDVRTPASPPGLTSLTLSNLGADGSRVRGESASAAFRFLRAPIGRESDLTRLVRVLLRMLKD